MKQTLLHDWHLHHGAHMAEFGGYRMPLWYKTGPIQEHRAVITHAGLFDTSHMAELLIEGPDARALLQTCLTKDLDHCLGASALPLTPGRATYGFLLLENGHVLDEAIVMMEGPERYLLVVNAGMGPAVAEHLAKHAGSLDTRIQDWTDQLSKFDIQGRASVAIMRKVLASPDALDQPLPYFAFAGHYDRTDHQVKSKGGSRFLLSRTGYTGEQGFEIFVRPEQFTALWDELLAAGSENGLIPCGLGARDSLRAGACLPLSHQDIGDWPCINHPWPFALPGSPGAFSKVFIGRAALEASTDAEYTVLFLGDNGRKVEQGSAVLLDGQEIGRVLTCATDMAIDRIDGSIVSLGSPDQPEGFTPRGLSCGILKVNQNLEAGTRVQLKDKRRAQDVTLVRDVRPHRTARRKLI